MVSQPWGLSGPQFLGVYAAAFVASLLVVAAVRSALRRGPARIPTADASRADVYTLAVLNGGRDRVVDTAVQALVAGGQLRVSRDHKIAVCGLAAPDEPVQQAVLACVERLPLSDLRRVRTAGRDTEPVVRVEQAAVDSGLLLGADRMRSARAAALIPAAVVGVAVARLVNGVRLGRPVGFLVLALVAGVVVTVIAAAAVSRGTRAGERLVERARQAHATAPEGFGSYGSRGAFAAAGLLVPAEVLGVAVLGVGGVLDPELRTALYGAPSSSGGGSSGSGGSCGSGDSGGGCGGGGCGGGGCGGGCGG